MLLQSRKDMKTVIIQKKTLGQRYHDRLLDGLLNLHSLPCDGLVQLPLKGQQIHVGLGLRDQVSDLRAGNQELRTLANCDPTEDHMRRDLWFRKWVSILTLCGSTLSAILRLLALKHKQQGNKMRSVTSKMPRVLWTTARWQNNRLCCAQRHWIGFKEKEHAWD